MAFLSTDSAEIYYEVQGKTGKWITLANGFTRSSSDFNAISRQLSASGFRTLTFDHRGSGQTQSYLDFTLEEMILDITHLWEHLEIRSSHLIGISMGGMISLLLASKFPEKIDKLCLVSTTPDMQYIENGRSKWTGNNASISQSIRQYFTNTFYLQNKLLIDAMIRQIQMDISENDFIMKAKAQKKALKHFRREQVIFSNLNMDTLIIHGDQDQIISPAAAKDLKNHIKNARLNIIKDAGHLLLAEKYLEFYNEIYTFFKHSGRVSNIDSHSKVLIEA